jgi:YesN/AraC family two-component response regulator
MERKTILLVEDEASVREIVRDVLKTDYCMLEASCYSEAARFFDAPFHLALIDYMLPDCDGFDIAKAVREQKPFLPIILMTAYNHEDLILKTFRSGLTDYLRKPLNLKYLRRKVAEIIEGKAPDMDSEGEVIKKSHEFRIDGLKEYIGNNYNKNLSLKALSKIACMSRSNLCRAFKARFEQNLVSYLNGIRVEKAAELLKNNDLSITEIALFVGFRSIENFGRKFKQFNGISPREYRQHIKGNPLLPQ